MITGILIVALVMLGAFLVGRRLKQMGSDMAVKLQQLRNQNDIRIYREEDWMAGTYRLFQEGTFIQLIVCQTTQTVFYYYDEDGNQLRVNYENHTPFFDRELPGESPAGA